jgi:hypothetical protein
VRRKGDTNMAEYKCDPHWMTVRFKGSACARWKRSIQTGERAFYYPQDSSLHCDRDDCGEAASREFAARAFEEDHNTSM